MFTKLKRWFQKHTQPQIIARGPKKKVLLKFLLIFLNLSILKN